MLRTARGSWARQATPYTVSVGTATSPPACRAPAAAASASAQPGDSDGGSAGTGLAPSGPPQPPPSPQPRPSRGLSLSPRSPPRTSGARRGGGTGTGEHQGAATGAAQPRSRSRSRCPLPASSHPSQRPQHPSSLFRFRPEAAAAYFRPPLPWQRKQQQRGLREAPAWRRPGGASRSRAWSVLPA